MEHEGVRTTPGSRRQPFSRDHKASLKKYNINRAINTCVFCSVILVRRLEDVGHIKSYGREKSLMAYRYCTKRAYGIHFSTQSSIGAGSL